MKTLLIATIAAAVVVLTAVRLLRNRLSQTGSASGDAPSAPARKAGDVAGLLVNLEIGEKTALFVLLAADGSINRKGTGTLEDLENAESGLFIGVTDPALFQAVRAKISNALMQRVGNTYELPNPRGAPCTLTVVFQFKDNTSDGFRFLYGSASERVPDDVAEFVIAAVKQTDPWHEEFQRNVSRKAGA